MSISFCYDRRFSYFAGQDYNPDMRYAMMRHGGKPDIGDDFEKFSRVMRPRPCERTRVWGGWDVAKPKNAKPRRKDHRASSLMVRTISL
jgi:hypothetical protein